MTAEVPDDAGVLGVVLAGGLSRRMLGRDKGLLPLAGRPLIVHAMRRLQPQVRRLVVNSNGDPARYADLGVAVVADTIAGHPGPLAGLLSAMRWAQMQAPDLTHVVSVPVDSPFFPEDLVHRLLGGCGDAMVAFATSPSGPQPVFALLPISLADELERDLVSGNAHKVIRWLQSRPCAEVLFSANSAIDPFFNINTPEDFDQAEAALRESRTPDQS